VLLGSETDASTAQKPQAALTALHAYASVGGRVLLQHFQSYFMQAGPAGVSSVATFSAQADLPPAFAVKVDSGSPRGQALAGQLLAEVGGEPGVLTIDEGRNGVTAVTSPAVRLLYAEAPPTVQAFSLDLASNPGDPACGRITQTDLLTASGDTIAAFPAGCTSTGMNAQEHALAYLIFDLGACL
jgi:hypothetical protein